MPAVGVNGHGRWGGGAAVGALWRAPVARGRPWGRAGAGGTWLLAAVEPVCQRPARARRWGAAARRRPVARLAASACVCGCGAGRYRRGGGCVGPWEGWPPSSRGLAMPRVVCGGGGMATRSPRGGRGGRGALHCGRWVAFVRRPPRRLERGGCGGVGELASARSVHGAPGVQTKGLGRCGSLRGKQGWGMACYRHGRKLLLHSVRDVRVVPKTYRIKVVYK